MEDPSRGLEMAKVPVLNGGDSSDRSGNFDGEMTVTIDFDKCNVRSLYQENTLWHDSAMNAFAAGLMSELKYMSLKSNMPKIHFDQCFLNYYQFRPTPTFDTYPIPKYYDVVFGFMQYMEKLDDGNIVNEHWLLVRFIKKNREVYFFDSGTLPADDTYLEALKNQALYAIVGYGWRKIENIHLQRYSTDEEWETAKRNKQNWNFRYKLKKKPQTTTDIHDCGSFAIMYLFNQLQFIVEKAKPIREEFDKTIFSKERFIMLPTTKEQEKDEHLKKSIRSRCNEY